MKLSTVEDFIGRRLEMYEVISSLRENRLVTIKGVPGIGKTTLAKAVACFLDERVAFQDGIILQSLRGIDSANMLFSRHLYILV